MFRRRDVGTAWYTDEPYFFARRHGDRFEAHGETRCFMGTEQCGFFAEWDWNGQRLRCRNDRYGFWPLFYFQQSNEIAISPSILQLLRLGASSEFDVAALAVFLRLGFFLGNDTPFRSIRVLPPGSVFEWNGESARPSGDYFFPTAESLSRDDAIDRYIGLFRAAINKSMPDDDHFAVPLSGGRDSRHILLEMLAAGARPKICPTVEHFPPRANSDATTSIQLAHALGVKHIILKQPRSRLSAQLRKNLRTNFCADELSFLMPLADYLPGEVHTAYDGLAGDILSAGHLQNAKQTEFFSSGSLENLSEFLISSTWFQLSEPLLEAILRPEFYKLVSRATAIARLSEELKRHGNAANPAASFFFWNRTRREIALSPTRLLARVARVVCPYTDPALCDFLLSLPATLTLDHRLHTDAIGRAYPRFKEIPFSQADASVDDRWFQRRLAFEMVGYCLAHKQSITQPGSLISRLLRRMVDGSHKKIRWLQAPRLVWLLQLDDVVTRSAQLFDRE